jgi:2,3,4,5-tetrahydropyridine-2-carboxylate N-succinyltransferase
MRSTCDAAAGDRVGGGGPGSRRVLRVAEPALDGGGPDGGWQRQRVAQEGGAAVFPGQRQPRSRTLRPRRTGTRFRSASRASTRTRSARWVCASCRARSCAVARTSGRDVVLLPSFVNIGAHVGAGTMVDTWATVGSCAQIGARCHLSGGAGIGGVLEPLQAAPTIIEDDCFHRRAFGSRRRE